MSQTHTHVSASGEQEVAATPRAAAWAQVITLGGLASVIYLPMTALLWLPVTHAQHE